MVEDAREDLTDTPVFHCLLKSLAGKVGQDESSLVNLLSVVLAELVLLLGGPAAEGLLDVAVGVLAADHETNLARGVGGNGGVGVFDGGEDGLARLLEVGDKRQVQPLVLGYESSQHKL
jgi:hypothetical protein